MYISTIQRKLNLGYNAAKKVQDNLFKLGYIDRVTSKANPLDALVRCFIVTSNNNYCDEPVTVKIFNEKEKAINYVKNSNNKYLDWDEVEVE